MCDSVFVCWLPQIHFTKVANRNTWGSASGNESLPTSGFTSSASDSDVRMTGTTTPSTWYSYSMNCDAADLRSQTRTSSNASSLVDSGTGSSQSLDTTGARGSLFVKGSDTSTPVKRGRSRSPSVTSIVSSTDIDEYMGVRRDSSWDTLTTVSSSGSLTGIPTSADEEPEEEPKPQRRLSIVHKSIVSKMQQKLAVSKTLSAPPVSKRLSHVLEASRSDNEAFEPVDDVFTAPPVPEDEPEVLDGADSPVEWDREKARSSLYRLLSSVPGRKFMSLPRSSGSDRSSTLWHDRHFVIQDEVAIFVVLPASMSQGRPGRGRRLKGSFSPYTRVRNVTKIMLEVRINWVISVSACPKSSNYPLIALLPH